MRAVPKRRWCYKLSGYRAEVIFTILHPHISPLKIRQNSNKTQLVPHAETPLLVFLSPSIHSPHHICKLREMDGAMQNQARKIYKLNRRSKLGFLPSSGSEATCTGTTPSLKQQGGKQPTKIWSSYTPRPPALVRHSERLCLPPSPFPTC